MPEIADILTTFGLIDELAGRYSDNPEVTATVERMLPGTTGYNQGWFSQVDGFLGALAVAKGITEEPALPSFDQALANLSTVTSGFPGEGTPWGTPHQAKGRYAAAVLSELTDVDERISTDVAQLPELIQSALSFNGSVSDPSAGATFQDLIRAAQPSNTTWRELIGSGPARALGFIDANEALVATFNRGRLRAVGNDVCTQLDTPYISDAVTLEQVKGVLDPLNWLVCGKPYWKNVVKVESPASKAKWTRIYEVLTPGKLASGLELTTALMYRCEEIGDGFVVNYDLDVDRDIAGSNTYHDGFVLVDQGFIRARPVDPKNPAAGVRIDTRKVASIQGLGSAALAMFAYTLGWANVGEKLLLGCAEAKMGQSPWSKNPTAPEATTVPPAKVPGIPQIKKDLRDKLIDKAVSTTATAITERSKTTGTLFGKWLRGELKPEDLKLAAAEAAADMADLQNGFVDAANELASFTNVDE